MEIHVHDENVTLKEILNNINTGLYQIQNPDNIRISSNNKMGFTILTSELDVSENLVSFFESNNYFEKEKSQITFERTYFDYFVVSLDEEGNILKSSIISLFELIVSSQFLNLPEEDKWLLDSVGWDCREINYDITIQPGIETDMRLFG